MPENQPPNAEGPNSIKAVGPENSSATIKTTLISVIGPVLVALVTTVGAIIVGSPSIRLNSEKIDNLKKPSLPVGTVVASILDPVEFAKAAGDPDNFDLVKSKWKLADGSSVPGTDYAKLRGIKPLPNLCGVFLRGKKNNSAQIEMKDVEEIDLGFYRGDKVGPHTHSIMVNNTGANVIYNLDPGIDYTIGHHTFGPDRLVAGWNDGPETLPKNVTVNYYIRINN